MICIFFPLAVWVSPLRIYKYYGLVTMYRFPSREIKYFWIIICFMVMLKVPSGEPEPMGQSAVLTQVKRLYSGGLTVEFNVQGGSRAKPAHWEMLKSLFLQPWTHPSSDRIYSCIFSITNSQHRLCLCHNSSYAETAGCSCSSGSTDVIRPRH